MADLISMLAAAAGASAEAGEYQISRSLRFNSADSAYLSRTPASAGNRKTWTWSGWVKFSGSDCCFMSARTDDSNRTNFGTVSSPNNIIFRNQYGATVTQLQSTEVLRDFSSFYHLVFAVDTTQATETNRVKIYKNGIQVTSFSSAQYPAQNADTEINRNSVHGIGRIEFSSPVAFFSGYMADVHFIDGQALTPSSFGEFNADTGVWSPIEYTGTYGTNGFYLNFSDNTSTTTLGYDAAGSNDWTLNNFSVAAGAGNDSLVDVPTRNTEDVDTGAGGEVRGNYCTLNPLDTALTGINNGNLNSGTSAAANWKHCRSTLQLTSGKWYWECLVSGTIDGSNGYQTGLLTSTASLTADPNSASTGFYTRQSSRRYTNGSSTDPYFTTTAANDIVMFAFDADTGKFWSGKNGTWEVSGDPAAGTNENWSSVPTNVFPMAGSYGSSLNVTVNFGQRPFAYTAPSGFKALCTTNLPDPTVVQGDDYFNTVLYDGNGTSQSITGVGFQPDFVWYKERPNVQSHFLFDVLRGVNNYLHSNATQAEATDVQTLTAFNSDGFSVGSNTGSNESGATYVAWNWKANGAGSSNTDGTNITTTVSANTTAGISILTYTGDGNGSSSSIGHGLGVVPAMVIIRSRGTRSWVVKHKSLSSGYNLYLESTAAQFTAASQNSGGIADLSSSTVVSFVNGAITTNNVNANAETYVAYCFAEVEGFSKFGSYTGNGSADGPMIFTGFAPAYVFVKRTDSTSQWNTWDNKRKTYNVNGTNLWLDASDAEITNDASYGIDLLSNGFKLRNTHVGRNASGGTYIFAAFAENPFKNALAR